VKIACVADVHLWNHPQGCTRTSTGPLNERASQIASSLADAKAAAVVDDADGFVVLGDLFDRHNPAPPLVAAAQDALSHGQGRDKHRPPVWVLMGNHDMASTEEGHHALGPLHGYGEIRVVAETHAVLLDSGDGDDPLALGFLPYRPEPVEAWLEAELDTLANRMHGMTLRGGPRARVLLMHAGLRAGDEPPWLREGHDSVDAALVQRLAHDRGFTAIMAGNWHERRMFDGPCPALQVGALVPTGWDNPGTKGYGTVAFYDSTTGFSMVEIPGPRFLNCTPEEARATVASRGGHPGLGMYRIRIKGTASDPQLVNDLKAQGYGYVAEVVDDDEARVAGRAAAREARDATTLDKALAYYVEELVVQEPADKATVLDMANRYLKGQTV